MNDKLEKYMKDNGFVTSSYLGKYNGIDVYHFSDEDCTGMPIIRYFENEEFKVINHKEYFDVLTPKIEDLRKLLSRFRRFSVSLKKFSSTKISTESSARIKSIFTTNGLTQTPSSVLRFSSVKYAKKMRMEKLFVMKQTVLRVPKISLQTIRMRMSCTSF